MHSKLLDRNQEIQLLAVVVVRVAQTFLKSSIVYYLLKLNILFPFKKVMAIIKPESELLIIWENSLNLLQNNDISYTLMLNP